MSMSMYEASVPTFLHTLGSLKVILQKGLAHAEAKKIDPAVLVNSRLFPDMFALARQVQIASDAAKSAAARLAGLDPPKFDDVETTFAELIARVDKTIDYLNGFKPAQLDGSEDRTIAINTPRGTLTFTGLKFLRHNGVEIGKGDFLGPIQ